MRMASSLARSQRPARFGIGVVVSLLGLSPSLRMNYCVMSALAYDFLLDAHLWLDPKNSVGGYSHDRWGRRTPTSEIEKSSITLVKMDFERISSSPIQNQRPLSWIET